MSKLPFGIKIVIRRDLVDQLEQVALFAARMGAASLHFVHVMPTSNAVEDESSLSLAEQRAAKKRSLFSRAFSRWILASMLVTTISMNLDRLVRRSLGLV